MIIKLYTEEIVFALGILLKFEYVEWCRFKYCSNISSFLQGVSSWDVDMNRDRCIWFGGWIVGRRCCERPLRLVVIWHRGCRRCRKRCLHGIWFAETFLLDQHADQEEDQSNPDHGCWRCLVGSNLVELLELLARVKFSIVVCLESWMAMWMPSV